MNREKALREIQDSIKEERGADLCGADLCGADLSGANLSGADLRSANLSGANLSGANLRGADLRSANLSGADLFGANLRSANLFGANLRSANLRSANLCGADLSSANLSGANLRGTNLEGATIKNGLKIKSLKVFTGLYRYIVFSYVDENNIPGVGMGCLWKTVQEWDAIGIENSNIKEFPDNGSEASEERKDAFVFARSQALRMVTNG